MSEVMKDWSEVRKMAKDLVAQYQMHREYEEEVSYDTDFADMLTDAIDANLALMPLEVAQDTVNRVATVILD